MAAMQQHEAGEGKGREALGSGSGKVTVMGVGCGVRERTQAGLGGVPVAEERPATRRWPVSCRHLPWASTYWTIALCQGKETN